MQLKMYVLCGSAVALWLIPLIGLNPKVSWHKAVQGISLCTAIACAVSAGNSAKKLADEAEIEIIKTRAITADIVDEISTETYISQQQRQQEAERILNGRVERSEAVEQLERALSLECSTEPVEPVTEPLNHLQDNDSSPTQERFTALELDAEQAIKLIQKLRTELNQTQIIEKLWSVRKGGSADWKRAREQFRQLTGE
ncbi:MAG: hypothetical protein ACRC62_27625 [Microcoleus sp.]